MSFKQSCEQCEQCKVNILIILGRLIRLNNLETNRLNTRTLTHTIQCVCVRACVCVCCSEMLDSNIAGDSHNKQWNHGYGEASQPKNTHFSKTGQKLHTLIAQIILDRHTHAHSKNFNTLMFTQKLNGRLNAQLEYTDMQKKTHKPSASPFLLQTWLQWSWTVL